ncbi:hypothetical protein SAMN04488691_1175 [Haloferax larsenii]|uniref:Small CPxCG-related zinc finger protein n=1 Tax=Haloferax larsenii TaxID=302484 RepID=A0A1H7V4H8_HALLR|nr:hypothetical protein SAMN04488691_1175 [Haloferax larsenii]
MFNLKSQNCKTCPRCGYLMRYYAKDEPKWVCGDCYLVLPADGGG